MKRTINIVGKISQIGLTASRWPIVREIVGKGRCRSTASIDASSSGTTMTTNASPQTR
jgi:hypothetical protein